LDDVLALAVRAVDCALAAGASEADGTATVVERFNAEARGETLVKLEQAKSRSLTVRAFIGGAKATLSTTDFSQDGLRELVRRVVDAARFVERDPLSGLPDSGVAPPDGDALELYFDDVRTRAPEAKIADTLALEDAIRAYDPRIDNSGGSRAADTITVVALASSRGFRGAYRSSAAVRATNPIARDGQEKRNAGYGSAARSYGDLEGVDSVARIAAGRAVGQCGARKPATARLPVIFERDVAGSVLADIFASVNAANVAVDDGLLVRGLGTSPFDAEGVPTRRTVVFERGKLLTFLYDTYYGRKLGARTTGNAAGGGIGPNNFYLAPGTSSLDELIAATPRGVLVLDTIGFATEHVTGTYSRGARGFMIEGGELAFPIDEFTIAGNYATMLGAVDAVASDLRFDGAIVSPSFRVAEMTIG
jgi:PmbA protein